MRGNSLKGEFAKANSLESFAGAKLPGVVTR
jgi:hypothetical protein